MRTQFRRAADETERHRLIAVLIPLIESTIGTGKLTVRSNSYLCKVPHWNVADKLLHLSARLPRSGAKESILRIRTEDPSFFRLDPAGSRSIQEIHFSVNPEREAYTFSRLNLDTGRHVRSTMSGRSAINVQNTFAPLSQRSIGHRLAAIHGIDRDVWMENARVLGGAELEERNHV